MEHSVLHSYNKTTKRNNNYNFKNNYLFLWFIPVLISAYLFLNSPNLIKEIESQQLDDSKINGIKSVLDNLRNKEGEYSLEGLAIREDKNVDSSYSSNDRGDDEEIEDDKLVVHDDDNEFPNNINLYLFEFLDDDVKLARLPYKFSSSEAKGEASLGASNKDSVINDIIRQSIENLITPPVLYRNRYQSLIPRGTRLIGFHLDEGILTLNFNEALLNDYYGEEGNRLKIAQIVSTMTAIHYVNKVIFRIEGKKVKYLDRDGLIINKVFASRDLL